MKVGNILITVASGLGALAKVPNHFNERATCNRDNLLRCFVDQRYSSQASDFCADLTPFTATVATSIITITTTLENTVTAIAAQVTELHTTTVFTETIPSATTVVTTNTAGVAKRQATADPPKCMTNGVTYLASRITSACSCIDVPVSTISVTHVVSTNTVTEINTIFETPLTTVTSWETVSTATTVGISTVTVLPPGMNRLANGDFETGDMTGWELSPVSWKTELYNTGLPWSPWICIVKGSGESLGSLRQAKPVYLEAGSYDIGLNAPPAPFPWPTNQWLQVVVFKLVNHAQGTTITPEFEGRGATPLLGRIVIPLRARFRVPEAAEGYYEVALAFLTQPIAGTRPTGSGLDEIFLKRV
ncbi:hypothetical protein FVEN_g9325 [Fusarium venenatum]|nr:hypothetical protein FVEN_g9325 [Fusarium venenatum]